MKNFVLKAIIFLMVLACSSQVQTMLYSLKDMRKNTREADKPLFTIIDSDTEDDSDDSKQWDHQQLHLKKSDIDRLNQMKQEGKLQSHIIDIIRKDGEGYKKSDKRVAVGGVSELFRQTEQLGKALAATQKREIQRDNAYPQDLGREYMRGVTEGFVATLLTGLLYYNFFGT